MIFKLSAGGEHISLVSPFGNYVDSLTYTAQVDDISFGKVSRWKCRLFLFTETTPDAANSAAGNIGTVVDPTFNIEGGFYEKYRAIRNNIKYSRGRIFTIHLMEKRQRRVRFYTQGL